MAFINRATALNVKSELDIFSKLPIQTTVESGALHSYRPVTSISNEGPVEFVVSGTSNDEYLDLGRVYIYVKVRLTTMVPPAVPGQPAPIPGTVGPVNNWLHSMFSQVDVYLNQKCITPPSNCYPYRAYIENLLNYSSESKKTHLSSGVWADDTANNMDIAGNANVGFTARRELTRHNQDVELYGPLHCDLFNVDKYLINGVEMTIKMNRANQLFHIMGTANSVGLFELKDAVLFVRKVKIAPGTLLAHHKVLNTATAKYPINRVDIRTMTIPQNTQSKTLDNIFLGTLPKRCVLGFVSTEAFNGSLTTNPFNFTSFNYISVGFYLDSVAVPTKPFNCDFATNQYIRAYHSLFEGSNINHSDIGNNISRVDYPNGYALLAVDFTPDLCSSATHVSLPKTGSLRIDVRFAAPLAQSITAIVFAEFDGLIEIDQYRNIVTDYSC
ncbi:uncharacterized protein F54H12.2-like [Bradysia coprophila]|uniref:uncharacterized protein F54H12.2-like n=1 Tax=Bradysia coprophila TaxID=38358 RepID=UPI00187DD9B0|nr:uncharacterized protein F54H12.2-like [Bradysia coprophila]XP_037048425.1 uncharacterized protein F54H12.2-like [Bradysia coprophila]